MSSFEIHGLNLEATELRLGIPGRDHEVKKNANQAPRNSNKRPLPASKKEEEVSKVAASSPKAQIVGWPPVRSYRKNTTFQTRKLAETEAAGAGASGSGMYVKVSMDGAPYLRKIDLKVYNGYPQLLKALENMFRFTIGEYSEREGYKDSEHAPTYEDKDGDLMLVGDVPWDMFITSCKKLRIMKGSEARGLGSAVL